MNEFYLYGVLLGVTLFCMLTQYIMIATEISRILGIRIFRVKSELVDEEAPLKK